jgi:hypothetical protein
MATLLGAVNGLWGIAAQQTGFLLEESSQSYSAQKATVKNITGDDTGVSHFNEVCEVSLSGKIPATSGFSASISTVLTLATVPADHLIGTMTSGITIIESIEATQSAEDYRGLSLTASYSPTVTSGS